MGSVISFIIGIIVFLALNPIIYNLPEKRAYSKNVFRYIFMGALGGGLAVITTAFYGYGLKSLTYFLFICVLAVVSFVDQDTMEIPPVLNLAILLLGVISIFTIGGHSIVDRAVGMLCISLPLYLIVLVIPDGFGGGDIKLMFATGLLLGWKANLSAFLIGVVLGGLYGIVALVRRKLGKKDHFAFGPFLCIGLVVVVFCGGFLVDAYGAYLNSLMS